MIHIFLVVIEGADKLRKTPVAKAVCEKTGFQYVKFPNPDNFAGQVVKDILQKKIPYEPASFQALNTIDRILTMRGKSGSIICDRYTLSGELYGEDDAPIEWLQEMSSLLPVPDLTFIFTGEAYGTDNELFDTCPINEKYKKYLRNHECDRIIEIDAHNSFDSIVDEILFWIWAFEV